MCKHGRRSWAICLCAHQGAHCFSKSAPCRPHHPCISCPPHFGATSPWPHLLPILEAPGSSTQPLSMDGSCFCFLPPAAQGCGWPRTTPNFPCGWGLPASKPFCPFHMPSPHRQCKVQAPWLLALLRALGEAGRTEGEGGALTWRWRQSAHIWLDVRWEGWFNVLAGGQVWGDAAPGGHWGRGVPWNR